MSVRSVECPHHLEMEVIFAVPRDLPNQVCVGVYMSEVEIHLLVPNLSPNQIERHKGTLIFQYSIPLPSCAEADLSWSSQIYISFDLEPLIQQRDVTTRRGKSKLLQ